MHMKYFTRQVHRPDDRTFIYNHTVVANLNLKTNFTMILSYSIFSNYASAQNNKMKTKKEEWALDILDETHRCSLKLRNTGQRGAKWRQLAEILQTDLPQVPSDITSSDITNDLVIWNGNSPQAPEPLACLEL